MTTKDQSLVPALDALANWRQSLARELSGLTRFFTSNDLLSAPSAEISESLRQRMLADKLVVAFVAEFSRGKSELINAIFFADTGRRILPASPGRTTMCPVELAWDDKDQPMLDLLPIDTRREGSSLTELRASREGWKRVPLDPSNPEALAAALSEVTHTRKVTPDVARELGLWSDTDPEDNPPLDEDGHVEVPAWRHAMINYPHPLLARDVGRDLASVRDFRQRGGQRIGIGRVERHALPALARDAQLGQRRAFAARVDRQQVQHRLVLVVPRQFHRAHRGAAGRGGEGAAAGVGEEDGVDQLGLAARELGDERDDQLVGQQALAQRLGDLGRRHRQQVVAGEEPGDARQFARQRLAPVGQCVEGGYQRLFFRRHAQALYSSLDSRRQWRRFWCLY